LSAKDKVSAGEFERGPVDSVLVVDVFERGLQGQDVLDQSGDVLRQSVVAAS